MRPAVLAAFRCRRLREATRRLRITLVYAEWACIRDLDGLHVIGLLAGAHDQLLGVALEGSLLALQGDPHTQLNAFATFRPLQANSHGTHAPRGRVGPRPARCNGGVQVQRSHPRQAARTTTSPCVQAPCCFTHTQVAAR